MFTARKPLILFALVIAASAVAVPIYSRVAAPAADRFIPTIPANDKALATYDDSLFYGDMVIACAEDPLSACRTLVDVIVYTSADTTGQTYTARYPYSDKRVGDDLPESARINRDGVFFSYLGYGADGVCDTIVFIQRGSPAQSTSFVDGVVVFSVEDRRYIAAVGATFEEWIATKAFDGRRFDRDEELITNGEFYLSDASGFVRIDDTIAAEGYYFWRAS